MFTLTRILRSTLACIRRPARISISASGWPTILPERRLERPSRNAPRKSIGGALPSSSDRMPRNRSTTLGYSSRVGIVQFKSVSRVVLESECSVFCNVRLRSRWKGFCDLIYYPYKFWPSYIVFKLNSCQGIIDFPDRNVRMFVVSIKL